MKGAGAFPVAHRARVPWALLVWIALLSVPWLGSRFTTFLATEIAILALFAVSLNLLLGYAGLVSFGHAAYFGIGAYTCAILMKTHGVPFPFAFAAAGVMATAFAVVFGFFCVRSTRIYFAMLTLAFAQIVWAICFKWNSVTGGEQGLSNVPYPDLGWMASLPLFGSLRTADHYFLLVMVFTGACFVVLRRIVDSPFGRMLTAIRENPERAEFVGLNVRLYQLAGFAVAGAFAGFAGALFGIFNRGVFPDFAYWSKSAEVLIMAILGGMGSFWGPAIGAAALTLLNHQISAVTQYWPLVLGSVLIVLLFAFPGGITGALGAAFARLRAHRDA
jgi:branched-chain amino acid transport system permease protein